MCLCVSALAGRLGAYGAKVHISSCHGNSELIFYLFVWFFLSIFCVRYSGHTSCALCTAGRARGNITVRL